MPVLKHPFLSAAAKGSFAKSTTFQQFRGATIARSYAIPANPRTHDQVQNRTIFKQASLQFTHLTENQRHGWRQLAIKYAHKKYPFSPAPHEQDFFISSNYYRLLCNKTTLYDPPTDTRFMGARKILLARYYVSQNLCEVNFEEFPQPHEFTGFWFLYMTPPRYISQLPYHSLFGRQDIAPQGVTHPPQVTFTPKVQLAPPPGPPPVLGNWVRIILMINAWLPSPAFTAWLTWEYA